MYSKNKENENLDELFNCDDLKKFLKKEPYAKEYKLKHKDNDHLEQINTVSSTLSHRQDYSVSICPCIKDSKVRNGYSINYILDQIKTGGAHKELILEGRAAGKPSKRYDEIKNMLPTFTPNATFNERRKAQNVVELSNLLYLDMDGSTIIDVNNPLVFATWKSLSNLGRGILVKVNGMTTNNIKEVYRSLAYELKIQNYVDYSCGEISRQNVISYDEELHVNKQSIVYEYKEEPKIKNTPIKVPSKNKKGKVCELNRGKSEQNFRWDNLNDFEGKGQDIFIFDEPVYFSKAFIPVFIPTGQREQRITTTVTQLVALNPNHPEELVNRLIDALNTRCEVPLPKVEVENIKNKIQDRRALDQIKLIKNFKRSTWFSDKVPTKERQKIGAKISGRNRIRKTRAKIEETLQEWDIEEGFKCTNKAIAHKAKLSINTVDKYSKYYKEEKAQINSKIKNCI